ncbi:uncharacterized protein LOC106644981 [Copidosoma floridanum]|uniref:uncharacterized protein LOC106644981 n=1 Tax=Copidosoma floridanum TaxID=29053 RepID=UPI000C6F4E1A|nr:uncharacterized protein LOC106644981 [Copidosoma floridanum]
MYGQFLVHDLPNLLRGNPVPVAEMWWQQDGCPAHNSALATDQLNEIFPRHWIGTNGPRAWPPRSPDLTPLDFWLWGVLKERCYQTPATTPENIIERIRRECTAITPAEIRRAIMNIDKRLRCLIEQHGNNFEQCL